jgi:hypothetical protein
METVIVETWADLGPGILLKSGIPAFCPQVGVVVGEAV